MNKALRIAEIADIRPGYLTREGVKHRADGTHCLLQLRDFNRERTAVNTATLIRFTPDSLTSLHPLQTGEVVSLARGAKIFAYAPAVLPVPTLAAGYFFVIHPHAQVHPAYLAWFLNQPATLRTLSRTATSGVRMPVVRRADIENLQIPVPPMPVQRAIIDLDNLMREEQSLLQDLARKKHELISTVCMAAAKVGRPFLADPGQAGMPDLQGVQS